ncbi:hypothetical protein KFE25_007450 [Diacronema lutheri]|uniref:Uncharacterized protein n=2 Tax=Diacronema lutheri TaxID=2081491 RepID=A0A8J5XV27_DIALT|nr:hypothetical protein KFE25_007450 [Diacronema lutheri]
MRTRALLHVLAASPLSSQLRSLAMSATTPALVVDPFCFRQFDDGEYAGTRIAMGKDEFAARANAHLAAHPGCLVEGYAPFCKHIFMENCVGATLPYVALTSELEPLVRSAYEARNDKELPVLARWIPASAVAPKVAKYLDLILYSREQLRKEAAAMGEPDHDDAPWGIISVKAQDEPTEILMNPITMMRNALGVEHGGSGVAIDRDKYSASVAFWQKHVVLR